MTRKKTARDAAGAPEKSSYATCVVTMHNVFPESIALDGLNNEKKVVRSTTKSGKIVRMNHHQPPSTLNFIACGNFFYGGNRQEVQMEKRPNPIWVYIIDLHVKLVWSLIKLDTSILPGRLRFSFIAINLFLFSSLLTPD
jgi:hypothetical protein